MKNLKFIPFTFLVGMDGFAYFLPYLLLCLMIHLVLRRRSERRLKPVLVIAR